MTTSKTRTLTPALWMLLASLFFPVQGLLSQSLLRKKDLKERLDEGSELVYTQSLSSVEKTTSGLYVKKTYYPETMQLTHYQSYQDRACTMLHGPYKEWLDNGKLWSEGNFKNGMTVGQWTFYEALSSGYESGIMRLNLREGVWVTSDSTGRKVLEHTYSQGLRHGPFVSYDGDKIYAEGIYANDTIVSGKKYNPDGSIIQNYYDNQVPPAFPCNSAFAQMENCTGKSLSNFLRKTLHYPPDARDNNISGNAIVLFVVKKDGSIGDVQCIRGICTEIKAECLRIMQAMPKWKPGMIDGKPIDVRFTFPIIFRLE